MESTGAVFGDDLAIDFQQTRAGGRPGNGGSEAQAVLAEAMEQGAIFVEKRDVLGKSRHIGNAVNERVLEMAAKLGAGFRNERHTAAAHGFRTDKAKALFDRGQDEDVAQAHELWNIVTMAEDMNAGMGQLRGEFLAVGGEKFASDEELTAAMGGRTKPGIEGEMKAFADGTDPDEKHSEAAIWVIGGTRSGEIRGFVVSVDVAGNGAWREAAVKKRLA